MICFVKILSDLDSRLAVQTSVLSKRWVHLWTTLPCLNFEPNPYAHTDSVCISNFVTNFLNYRNQESVISTIKVDCICYLDEIISNVPCLNASFIGTLYVTNCGSLRSIDDWVLPSLTSLYLRNVFFGGHISGFQNLKELTLTGCSRLYFAEFGDSGFTINCPNLQRLALGSDFSHCSLVVSTPKLCYFEFRSFRVPYFSSEDGFPCIEEVDFDIKSEESEWDLVVYNHYKKVMHYFIPMLNSVRETPLLRLSSKTIQFFRRVPDFSKFQPCPLCNLKFLYLQGRAN